MSNVSAERLAELRANPITVDATGLRFGVIGCEECYCETAATGPDKPDNCQHCGVYLWEDDEPADLPEGIASFSRDL